MSNLEGTLRLIVMILVAVIVAAVGFIVIEGIAHRLNCERYPYAAEAKSWQYDTYEDCMNGAPPFN